MEPPPSCAAELHRQWMNLQQTELDKLRRVLPLNSDTQLTNDSELDQLINETLNNFENYIKARTRLAQTDPSLFFASRYCTTLENSGVWLAGCRPSSFIRLLYALTGLESESRLVEFLDGEWTESLGQISPEKMTAADDVRRRTIREEERLSRAMAVLQEDMVDLPLVESAMKKMGELSCESDRRVESVLDENRKEMKRLMEEADELRLKTVKELISILTKVQAVQFLAAAKKIRLCMSEWGKKRDEDYYKKSG